MKIRASILILILLISPAESQAGTDVCFSSAQLLERAKADLAKAGLMGLEPDATEMGQALAAAQSCFPIFTRSDGSLVMLADGTAETVMTAGIMAAKKVNGVTLLNPFPSLSLLLGSYYNEVGRPREAITALDQGLKLTPLPEAHLGTTVPSLISEKGAAFNALKQFDDALSNYNEGLKLTDLSNADRARLYRGRGFALTELGKLDEAETAYRESLKLMPEDTRAPHELLYIARLRAGKAKTGGYLTTQAPPSAQQDVPADQQTKKPD